MENTNVTEIVQALITLLAALISAVVVPWIKGKVGEQNMNDFLRWVEIGVAAAEQLYRGADPRWKKDYVVTFLNSKGFTMNEEELDNAIEAAVLKLHADLYGTAQTEVKPDAE